LGALSNCPIGLLNYGLDLFLGCTKGSEKHPKEAFKIWLKGADLNDPGCLSNVGYCYGLLPGHANKKKLAHYTKLAVEAGSSSAMVSLGKLYAQGLGVVKNDQKAVHYFNLSAKKRDSDGLYSLGSCYETGYLLKKSRAKAINYLAQSAQLGNKKALKRLKNLFKRDGVAIHMRDESLTMLEKVAA
jgi:TPR repeat protein